MVYNSTVTTWPTPPNALERCTKGIELLQSIIDNTATSNCNSTNSTLPTVEVVGEAVDSSGQSVTATAVAVLSAIAVATVAF